MPAAHITRHLIEARRRMVARLALHGLSSYAIHERLADAGMVNPKTGKAWDARTIRRDLAAIRVYWKRQAAEAVEEHRGRQMAELQEVRRAAWKIGSHNAILKSLSQEAELLGTNAPKKTALTDPTGEHALDLGFDQLRETILEQLEKISETELETD